MLQIHLRHKHIKVNCFSLPNSIESNEEVSDEENYKRRKIIYNQSETERYTSKAL